MIMASVPPMASIVMTVTRYWMPTTLWSVVNLK